MTKFTQPRKVSLSKRKKKKKIKDWYKSRVKAYERICKLSGNRQQIKKERKKERMLKDSRMFWSGHKSKTSSWNKNNNNDYKNLHWGSPPKIIILFSFFLFLSVFSCI